MKKKFLTVIIIAVMTVSLVACGSSATEETTVATETSEVVETTETTETVESSVEAETETTEEVVETETTATVEETESPAAETGKKAETKTATEKTTDNVTEKQQAASNDVQPSSDNGGGSASAPSGNHVSLSDAQAFFEANGWAHAYMEGNSVITYTATISGGGVFEPAGMEDEFLSYTMGRNYQGNGPITWVWEDYSAPSGCLISVERYEFPLLD